MLAEAAKTLGSQRQALQLRYLQTLTEVANESTNTIIFPLPIDLIEPFMDAAKAIAGQADQKPPVTQTPRSDA